ncbi:MAG: hypothetical protein C0404_11900 [Verrucomicrobia bacterium]|nr:hypothetical protein [Verrucomicrobiota bacterium]
MPAARQEPLFPRVVDLVERVAISTPPRLVYSTQPFAGMCSDGKVYIIKGASDQMIVRAEASAYVLAQLVGVSVPEWSFVSAPGHADHPLFGSRIVSGPRDISPWLNNDIERYSDVLAQIITFDMWVANTDRNLSNLVGRNCAAQTDGYIDIVAIDFEKSVTVRSTTPRIALGSITPHSLWPRELLGRMVCGRPRPQNDWVANIAGNSALDLAPALQEVQIALSLEDSWLTDITDILAHRATRVPMMVEEVWH